MDTMTLREEKRNRGPVTSGNVSSDGSGMEDNNEIFDDT